VKMKAFSVLSMAALCGVFSMAQAQVKEHTFRFATANPTGHPIVTGAEKFAELVSQKSGGKMTVKLFPGGVLGGDVQVLSAVQGGTIDLTSMNSGILQGQVKEYAALDFPFLFNDGREADAVVDGPIGKQLADKLPAKGLVSLTFYELGFRNLTNSKRPIYIDTFSALGANPVPMPITEVYTAMEQKTIDGHENPFTVIEANKFYEVQKYLTVSRHIYNPQSLLMSKRTWDRLSKEEQDIIVAAATESTPYQRKVSRDAQDKSLATLKTKMEVTELPAAEIAKIRTKLQPVIAKYSAEVGPDFVKQLYSEIDKVRK
jgi:TRAP-type transport system periplasmic protein